MEKDPKSMAISAIDNARTKAIIEEGRKNNKSGDKIIEEVFGDEKAIGNVVKDICVINLLESMGKTAGLAEFADNKAFVGLSHIRNHYTGTDEARRYDVFWNSAKTVLDVLVFFLTENDLDETVFTEHPDYNHDYVESHLYLPLTSTRRFSLKSPSLTDYNHDYVESYLRLLFTSTERFSLKPPSSAD